MEDYIYSIELEDILEQLEDNIQEETSIYIEDNDCGILEALENLGYI